MPTGDPIWECKYCGRTHYMGERCTCKDALEEYMVKKSSLEFFKEPTMTLFKAPIPVTMHPPIGEVGVIVGRFQNAFIHDGYKELFDFVQERHPRVFVFVGNTPVRGSKKDPLPFQARRAMIETEYPQFEVFKMDDAFNMKKWSQILDRQIDLLAGPGQKVTLYGSRDRFKYTGKHKVEDVPCKTKISSTELRRALGVRWQNDRKWREGVIWLSQNRFPVCYPTVDMACINLKENTVWMGRKPNEDLFRFPGGFADIHSDSYESDALRELQEEFCVEGKSLEYIGSTIADDPRYRTQEDKIKTLFYAVTHWGGIPTPGDDLLGGEVKLFNLDELEANKETLIVPTHRVLVTMLGNWRNKLATLASQLKK